MQHLWVTSASRNTPPTLITSNTADFIADRHGTDKILNTERVLWLKEEHTFGSQGDVNSFRADRGPEQP